MREFVQGFIWGVLIAGGAGLGVGWYVCRRYRVKLTAEFEELRGKGRRIIDAVDKEF